MLGVILAVMRLSPNPVFRSVSWVFLWIFRGTPIYVQLVFWGLIPTIYKNIQLGMPFGPSFFHLEHAGLVHTLSAGDFSAWRSTRPPTWPRSSVPASVPCRKARSEASTALGMSWGMTMRRTVLPQAMRVIIPPTGNEFISMLKTTSLVTAVPYSHDLYGSHPRDRRA